MRMRKDLVRERGGAHGQLHVMGWHGGARVLGLMPCNDAALGLEPRADPISHFDPQVFYTHIHLFLSPRPSSPP
jgi:hypothetical protein